MSQTVSLFMDSFLFVLINRKAERETKKVKYKNSVPISLTTKASSVPGKKTPFVLIKMVLKTHKIHDDDCRN